ncbi:MAG: hypothetical protein JSS38_16840 [Nitrospira sp.]|nr:hypothetical protein [Nitrospira sp.]MBS0156259.1 hypothetical protein [Nitrospira sp.]
MIPSFIMLQIMLSRFFELITARTVVRYQVPDLTIGDEREINWGLNVAKLEE